MNTRVAATNVRLKRAYQECTEDDGQRILIDRLWPRGVSKSKANIACWMKEIAPSADLRNWFGHDPRRWDEFRNRYLAELANHREEVGKLRSLARSQRITLVYAARDERHNDAIVLRDYLLDRSANRDA
jgi:uncharacterized protein YeaO (DUF488 family)